MGKTMKMVKKPNSIFRKLEITSITDIFEIFLMSITTQEVVNDMAFECANFLFIKKQIDQDLIIKHFNFSFFLKEPDHILVQSMNLLSSLWIIGIYPKNPEKYINKTLYKEGDFTYKFLRKNNTLTITKKKCRKTYK